MTFRVCGQETTLALRDRKVDLIYHGMGNGSIQLRGRTGLSVTYGGNHLGVVSEMLPPPMSMAIYWH
jgi:hypothetical protein